MEFARGKLEWRGNRNCLFNPRHVLEFFQELRSILSNHSNNGFRSAFADARLKAFLADFFQNSLNLLFRSLVQDDNHSNALLLAFLPWLFHAALAQELVINAFPSCFLLFSAHSFRDSGHYLKIIG